MGDPVKAFLFFFIATLFFFLPIFLKGELINPIGLALQRDPIFSGQSVKGNINPLLSDLAFEFYPWRMFANSEIKNGRIPFWNPTIYGGIPYVANDQSAVFYPLNLFFNLFSLTINNHPSSFRQIGTAGGAPRIPTQSEEVRQQLTISLQFTFIFFSKILLASFFTYLFVRSLKVSFASSILSGLIFSLSGFFTVWLGYGITNVAVFLPLVLWVIRKIREKGFKSVYSLILIFGWTSQLLAGHLESFALLVPFYGVYIFYEFVFLGGRTRSDIVGINVPTAVGTLLTGATSTLKPPRFLVLVGLSIIALVSIVLSAVQWFPFLQFISKTAIFSGRVSNSFNLFDFSFLKNLPSVITFLAPNFFGNPLNNNSWNPFLNYNEGIFYVGLLPLLLALITVIGALKPRRFPNKPPRFGVSLFWVFVALSSLLLSLLIPPFNFLAKLPILSILDFKRYRLLLTFSLAILAGLGLDKWLGGELPHSLQKIIVKLYLAFGLAYSVFLATGYWLLATKKSWVIGKAGLLISRFASAQNGSINAQALYERWLSTFSPLSWKNLYPVIFLLLTAILFWSFNYLKKRLIIWKFALLLTVFLDLGILGLSIQPILASSIKIEEPPIIAEIKKDQSLFRVAALGEWVFTPNLASVFGLQDVRGADIVSADYQKFFFSFKGANQTNLYFWLKEADHDFLDLTNVKYIIVRSGYNFDKTGFKKKGNFGRVELWENKQVWPRVFVVESLDEVADNQAISKPPRFRNGVVTGRAEITVYQSDKIEAKVQIVSELAFLVLSDVYDDKWQVFVDGKRAELLKVYSVLRAVKVTSGEHLVEFIYRPFVNLTR